MNMATADSSFLNRYLGQLRATAPLSREQELELARAYQQRGDREAAEKLIASNLRHVVPLALRYRHLGLPLADLIAQGNLGLFAALDRFEPERGLRLATYANHWVRAEMLQLALKHRNMVGGGRGALSSKYVFRLRREHALLLAKTGETDAANRELAHRYGKQPAQIEEILQRIDQHDASLDAGTSHDPDRSLSERLHEEPDVSCEESLDRKAYQAPLADAVADATARLNERERYIVENRLMADADTRHSLCSIGKRFGVSRERARQLEQAVKAKLRSRLSPLVAQLELQPAA